MTITTPNRELGVDVGGLVHQLRARWDAAPHANHMGFTGDVVDDAIDHLIEALIGGYRVDNLDETWLEPKAALAADAGRQAWEQYVLPAIVHELAVHIAEAPDWILAHPESGRLRADLDQHCVR